jgi:hypothetical protein
MSEIDSQLRHDFINNSLRLEVLMKMISKDLQSNQMPNQQYIEDLDKFLNAELNMLKDLRQQLYSN